MKSHGNPWKPILPCGYRGIYYTSPRACSKGASSTKNTHFPLHRGNPEESVARQFRLRETAKGPEHKQLLGPLLDGSVYTWKKEITSLVTPKTKSHNTPMGVRRYTGAQLRLPHVLRRAQRTAGKQKRGSPIRAYPWKGWTL